MDRQAPHRSGLRRNYFIHPFSFSFLFNIFFFLVRGGDFFNSLISQIYAVQFHLFVTCVLFLSREGFRRACMRADIKWFLLSLTHSSFFFLRFNINNLWKHAFFFF